MQLDPKKMIEAMTQAMAGMYYTQKYPSKEKTSMKPTGGKPYLAMSKPPEIMKGLNGTNDPYLTCCYCKVTGDNHNNCKKLQNKIQKEQIAAESIIMERALKEKHL